ncbi:hypothetical protein VNO77_44383 [Canavalia gladiata]|uniref:Uncharacterized protein n=1 Tax=Canavalia gladiata TaxID=3824 RepID=A0AAN9JWY8_CANGL
MVAPTKREGKRWEEAGWLFEGREVENFKGKKGFQKDKRRDRERGLARGHGAKTKRREGEKQEWKNEGVKILQESRGKISAKLIANKRSLGSAGHGLPSKDKSWLWSISIGIEDVRRTVAGLVLQYDSAMGSNEIKQLNGGNSDAHLKWLGVLLALSIYGVRIPDHTILIPKSLTCIPHAAARASHMSHPTHVPHTFRAVQWPSEPHKPCAVTAQPAAATLKGYWLYSLGPNEKLTL